MMLKVPHCLNFLTQPHFDGDIVSLKKFAKNSLDIQKKKSKFIKEKQKFTTLCDKLPPILKKRTSCGGMILRKEAIKCNVNI